MSGNPFRASLVPKPTSVPTSSAPNSFDYADSKNLAAETQDDVKLPAKTKKSVRIESPASSPPHPAFYHGNSSSDDELPQQIQERSLAALPPLTSPAGLSDNFEDQMPEQLAGSREGRKDAHEALDVAGSSRRHSGIVHAALSPSGAPFNPFSRTLATIEKQEKSSGEGYTAGQNRDRPVADRPSLGTTKPSLDVESFKRLLMTGIQSPSSSGQHSQIALAPTPAPAPHPTNPSHLESSSSTDTSSVSRQSIFEPVQEPHIETPRTSYEMAASDEDERVGLIGEDANKIAKVKSKPPPPRHRHGKPVTVRTPQIVSFEDFNVTQPTTSPVSRIRTGSDLNVNKPLPLPPTLLPTAHIFSKDAPQDEPPPLETRASESSSHSDTPSVQKKIPPPVPIARRQSQLRTSTIGNRSRSNSSLTISSQHSIDHSPLNSSLATFSEPTSFPAGLVQKTPPPPPPARRHGSSVTNSINLPSNSSSTTELPATASSRRTPVSSPNAPPSRRPTFPSPPPSPSPTSTAGLARTSSISSNFNRRSVSGESVTMSPPPPPPPRRRQSGRSSLDQPRSYTGNEMETSGSRRTSMEKKRSSFDSKRRTSVNSESSLRHEYGRASHEYARGSENEHVLYSPKEERGEDTQSLGLKEVSSDESGEALREESSGSSNILDDMERFQREIDELRKKYPTAG